jgi:hypothetical protein
MCRDSCCDNKLSHVGAVCFSTESSVDWYATCQFCNWGGIPREFAYLSDSLKQQSKAFHQLESLLYFSSSIRIYEMRRSAVTGLRPGGNKKRAVIFCSVFAAALFYLLFFHSSESVSPPSSTTEQTEQANEQKKLEVAIGTDVERIASLHKMVWRMMKLSPQVEMELNTLATQTDRTLQSNKHFHPSYYESHSQNKPPKASLSKDDFENNHKRRFNELGLSKNAVTELTSVMETLWRTLYEPNAYLDPLFDKELSQNLKILFQDSPPKCCDEEMYKRAKIPEKPSR